MARDKNNRGMADMMTGMRRPWLLDLHTKPHSPRKGKKVYDRKTSKRIERDANV